MHYLRLFPDYTATVLLCALLSAMSYMPWVKESTILPKEKMVDILVDLELAKAMVYYHPKDKQDAWKEQEKQRIYRDHGTSQVIFQQSLLHYLHELQVMKEIYEEVVSNLRKLRKKLKKASGA